MRNRQSTFWATRLALVSSLTIVGVLGTTLPATAAQVPRDAATTSAAASSAAGGRFEVTRSGASAPLGAVSDSPDGRSWGSLLRAAKEAIKKVPALWNKAVQGAKKGYAYFRDNVWPAIKFVVKVVSAAITAWDVWNLFR